MKKLLSIFVVSLLFLGSINLLHAAYGGTTELGDLNGQGGWELSERKGADAPSSPQVVSPGLGGSSRAALFHMIGYDDPTNDSTQHNFPSLSGTKITVEIKVKPSSNSRCITVAIRNNGEGAAYIRFKGNISGWCQQYDNTDTYRDIAPYTVDAANILKVELNTSTKKLKAWVNGVGGSEWNFHSNVSSINRIDLFMTHGNGPETWSIVDDITVRNDAGTVVFSEDFESYYGGDFPPIIGDVGISSSGHYFTYKGNAKMILADSGTQCVMQNLNIDYGAWVNACADEGHPSVHIWAFIAPRQNLDGSKVESRYGYVYPGITPWPRKTSGDNAHDGGKQWDLFSFDEGADPNQQYWPRLRDLCQQLKNKNMMLGITVFFGWPKDIPGDLNYHPFYHLNGGPATSRQDITHIHSPGTEVHTQSWSDLWPIQKKTQWFWEKFCLKLINETSVYGNVWFDFRDEWSYDNDTNMEAHFHNFFRGRGQVWADRSTIANFRVTNGPGARIPPFGETPAMKTEGGPYDHEGVRGEVWKRAMSGIHYLLHEDERLPGIMAWDPVTASLKGTDPTNDLGRKYVGYASYFFNNYIINLDIMLPNNNLVNGSNYCLANTGHEYAIYLPDGGSVTVDLSDTTGNLNVKWYNPRNGTYTDAGTVSGGGSEIFTPPFSDDEVLHINKPTDLPVEEDFPEEVMSEDAVETVDEMETIDSTEAPPDSSADVPVEDDAGVEGPSPTNGCACRIAL